MYYCMTFIMSKKDCSCCTYERGISVISWIFSGSDYMPSLLRILP